MSLHVLSRGLALVGWVRVVGTTRTARAEQLCWQLRTLCFSQVLLVCPLLGGCLLDFRARQTVSSTCGTTPPVELHNRGQHTARDVTALQAVFRNKHAHTHTHNPNASTLFQADTICPRHGPET